MGLALGLGMGVPLVIGGIGYRVYKKKEDKRREMNIVAARKSAEIYNRYNVEIENQIANIVTGKYKELDTKLKWIKFVDPTWDSGFIDEYWNLVLKKSIPKKIGRKLTLDEQYALDDLLDE